MEVCSEDASNTDKENDCNVLNQSESVKETYSKIPENIDCLSNKNNTENLQESEQCLNNTEKTSNDSKSNTKFKRFNFVDNDSSGDEEANNDLRDLQETDAGKRAKKIIDSESEDDLNSTPHRSFIHGLNQNETDKAVKSKFNALLDSDNSEDDLNENERKDSEIEELKSSTKGATDLEESEDFNYDRVHKSKLNALCDSESSEDEHNENEPKQSDNEENVSTVVKPMPYKKAKSSKNDEKKMSGREAAEQRKLIEIESQRRLRETNVSLPYHRPKTYSLKEFLEKRSRFASTVPEIVKASAPVALKMSKEQLELVSKKIKERQKEVEQFYKSESETSDEETSDQDENNTETNPICNTEDPPANEDTLEEEESSSKPPVPENVEASSHSVCDSEEATFELEKGALPEESFPEAKNGSSPEKLATVIDCETENIQAPRGDSGIGTEEIITMDCDDEFENKEVSSIVENFIHREEESAATSAANKNQLTEDYDFNIDDIEEENTEESTLKSEPEKKIRAADIIKEKFGNIQPRLSGGPNEVIDLESGVTRPNEITQLMERFIKHTAKPKLTNHKIHMSIVNVTGGQVREETVDMTVDDEEPVAVMETPGAKLQKLRTELETQMAKKRSEYWKQKKAELTEGKEDQYDGEKSECGAESDATLDDEEEEEMSETCSEEEDIEEDVEIKDKPEKKCDFVEEEAEESETEECDETEEQTEEKDENNEDADDESEDNSGETNEMEQPKKKQLKRIIKPFSDDEDDSDEDNNISFANLENAPNCNKEQYESTISCEDDDYFPPHQNPNSNTPIRLTQSKQELGFLTPVSYLTGLQNMSSAHKFLKDSSQVSPVLLLNAEPSPLKNLNFQSPLQKKLFNEPSEATESATTQELLAVCSGNFSDLATTQVIEEELAPVESNTQDLLNICSGKFTGLTQETDSNIRSGEFTVTSKQTEKPIQPTTQDLLEVCSGGFTGIEKTGGDKVVLNLNGGKEIKSLDEDNDQIISQLLDEDEMERFKKKFVSPPKKMSRIVFEGDEVAGGGGVIDSDEENELEVKKKKKKQLVFSDDESDEEQEGNYDDEEINLHDEDDAENVDYDSEENEIDLQQPVYAKASDFFENEAELSESEWGSEDEDEKDLDKMEFELADNEKIDQAQVQRDLERIHLRRMLDEDNREVKILQELYLEDGELHGTGRQRQFKWKNINALEDEPEEEKETAEDEAAVEDEESEEQWRKMRHKREMFLQQKNSQTFEVEDDSNILSETQIFKFGQRAIVKNLSANSTPNSSESNKELSADSPFALLGKRGSFLSRNDQVLERLAEFTKVTKTVVGTAKNSHNFLFQTISSEENQLTVTQDKKRKLEEGTPNAIKKLRLSSNFSPANGKKKFEQPSRAKNLFNVKQW